MAGKSDNQVGKDNAKVPDTDIQGDKAGKRNRSDTEAGKMPPPAGESRPGAADPRRPQPGRS
jgi:hypothetical protein